MTQFFRLGRPGRTGDRRGPRDRGRHRPPASPPRGRAIAVFDRDHDAAQALAGELEGLPLVGDVCSQDQVAGAVDLAERTLGPLSILVNNAGITGRADVSWKLDAGEVRGLRGSI